MKMQVNGVNYHVETHGQGSPLVLLHGFTGSTSNWLHLIPLLAANHQVITIDLLGHGKSDSPTDAGRYQMQYAASDISTLLEKLSVPQAGLLGYSMGGRLALYFALHHAHQVSRLILESTSPGIQIETERRARRVHDNQLAEQIERDGVRAFVDDWQKLPLFASQNVLSPEIQRRLRLQRLQNNPAGLSNSLRGMGTGAQPSLWSKLQLLTVPTMLIAGELDAKFVAIAQEMRTYLPTSKLHIVPCAGHTVHLEQPDEYCRHILEFLQTSA